jgi:hypothetical protein
MILCSFTSLILFWQITLCTQLSDLPIELYRNLAQYLDDPMPLSAVSRTFRRELVETIVNPAVYLKQSEYFTSKYTHYLTRPRGRSEDQNYWDIKALFPQTELEKLDLQIWLRELREHISNTSEIDRKEPKVDILFQPFILRHVFPKQLGRIEADPFRENFQGWPIIGLNDSLFFLNAFKEHSPKFYSLVSNLLLNNTDSFLESCLNANSSKYLLDETALFYNEVSLLQNEAFKVFLERYFQSFNFDTQITLLHKHQALVNQSNCDGKVLWRKFEASLKNVNIDGGVLHDIARYCSNKDSFATLMNLSLKNAGYLNEAVFRDIVGSTRLSRFDILRFALTKAVWRNREYAMQDSFYNAMVQSFLEKVVVKEPKLNEFFRCMAEIDLPNLDSCVSGYKLGLFILENFAPKEVCFLREMIAVGVKSSRFVRYFRRLIQLKSIIENAKKMNADEFVGFLSRKNRTDGGLFEPLEEFKIDEMPLKVVSNLYAGLKHVGFGTSVLKLLLDDSFVSLSRDLTDYKKNKLIY